MSAETGSRRAFVGLGSNLDDPAGHIRRAARELDDLTATRLVDVSSLYGSRPMGPSDQPDYVNAVAEVATGLAPLALLDALQELERHHRRVRVRRWGPRTLDLDLLVYADLQMRAERLTLPHPGLHERNFVLYPLAELAPDLHVPGKGRVVDLLAGVSRDGLWKLEHE
ncbi:MAG: 2-amino-4-hydroxy-6-hydroxymethyldihydropteridine diphosphokinase [Gammaproteobacteria bacterium]|jgi:2-amino-4-hydroxy-6-hydroxymethyldihydropteridine diphosphokinase